jgi:branched-chain amino acid transport system substrate-binding protein
VFVAFILAGAAAGPAPARSPQPLTIYSSLPFSGASQPHARGIARGAALALEEADSSAGGYPIRYVSLDDSTRRAGTWTPSATARNARMAARDPSALAYIGELNSGASAISMPILNRAGIAQISPSNTANSLTRGGPGTVPGEPGRYYPTGRRHYVRLAPNDRVQGAALATLMRRRGCRRVAVITDGEIYGSGVGHFVRRSARVNRLRVVFRGTIGRLRSYRVFAARVARRRPSCVVFTGITANGAVRLFADLARALPRAGLFGSDGIAESGFSDPRQGGLPRRVARRVLVTIAPRAPLAYPPGGRDFFRRYGRRYGDRNPDPYAIFGYEAMRLALDAVAARGADRQGVIDWLRAVRDRDSVLGTYGFDRYGDTTLGDYGAYRISRGRFVWAGRVTAKTRARAANSRPRWEPRDRSGAGE